MDILSIENLIDIREAITRRLQELKKADTVIPQAQTERVRKIISLEESLKAVQEKIESEQYETLNKPGRENVYLCPRCGWEGLQRNTDTWTHGSYNIDICPNCGEHNLKKL